MGPPLPDTVHRFETFLEHPNSSRTLSIVVDPNVELDFRGDRIAVDRPEVTVVEDMQEAGIDHRTGLPCVARSIVDLNGLNRGVDILKGLIESVKRGELPDRIYPEGHKKYHYGTGKAVRSITTPFCRQHDGTLLTPGPTITDRSAVRMSPTSRALHTNSSYKITEGTVHQIAEKQPIARRHMRECDRRTNATVTTSLLFGINNAIISQWAASVGLTQITSSVPRPMQIGDTVRDIAVYVSTTDSEVRYGIDTMHASYQGAGGRRLAGLFNTLQVGWALEHNGQAAFDVHEGHVFAGWLTAGKVTRRIRQRDRNITR
ncbi:hypothetical protein KC992_01710 [Candidatus Saccharibacteria bacterium]|nr:hypothetical protein [Candidatus Saccharibacteria bacterium]MCA9328619.1 hypothetical protein [Candidatus Saccharibacteria bacterium]